MTLFKYFFVVTREDGMSGWGMLWHIFFNLRAEHQRDFLKHHHGFAALFSTSNTRMIALEEGGAVLYVPRLIKSRCCFCQLFSWKVREWTKMCCRAPRREQVSFDAGILLWCTTRDGRYFLCMQLCSLLFFRETSYIFQFVRCFSQGKAAGRAVPMRWFSFRNVFQ